MKFSTKGRYALRLMLELSQHPSDVLVSLKEVSEHQGISLKYMEQIVTPLSRAGLVKAERGSQGGYTLSKIPEKITAGDILRAVEGDLAPIPCLGDKEHTCPMEHQCATLPFWAGLEKAMEAYADSVTLKDLQKQARDMPGGCI